MELPRWSWVAQSRAGSRNTAAGPPSGKCHTFCPHNAKFFMLLPVKLLRAQCCSQAIELC